MLKTKKGLTMSNEKTDSQRQVDNELLEALAKKILYENFNHMMEYLKLFRNDTKGLIAAMMVITGRTVAVNLAQISCSLSRKKWDAELVETLKTKLFKDIDQFLLESKVILENSNEVNELFEKLNKCKH